MKSSIRKTADALGVSIGTLRRWERIRKIRSERTLNRRCDLNSLNLSQINLKRPRAASLQRKTIVYGRVSSKKGQKEDLQKQILRLESYCAAHGWTYEVIADLESGLNYQNKGLKELSFEEELAQDVLEIIPVFSARLYGARSHQNKKIVQALKEAADAARH